MSKVQQKIALVTVSSITYWPGTLVMLKSFLKANSWFSGFIQIITIDKAYIEKKLLKHRIEAKVIEPNQALTKKVEKLINAIPAYKNVQERFYLFELFSFSEFDRILYCDSDIVHLAPFPKEIMMESDFSAVRDPWYIRGFIRDRVTLQKIPKSKAIATHNTNFFNSGVLVVGSKFLLPKISEKLIDRISADRYEKQNDLLADEPVLNDFFENQVSFLPIKFNCPVHLIIEKLVNGNIACLHFTGKNKPWSARSWLKLLYRNRRYSKYLFIWIKYLYFNWFNE